MVGRLAAMALVCAVSGAMPDAALAQDGTAIESVINQAHEAGRFDGAALVVRGNEVLLDRGYGKANLEWDIPNGPDTRFRIGSVSKQFTAAAILKLRERNAVDLDASVRTYLSDAPAAWQPVTLRHLLHQSSGVPDLIKFEDFDTWNRNDISRADVIARIGARPLGFVPGEKFEYSNSNYVVLSAVIEAVSGQSYGDFVAAEIFAPAGMAHSQYDDARAIIPHRASGYGMSPDGMINAGFFNMDIAGGGGGLLSTTHDLLKWEEALFAGKVISTESVALMTTPSPLDIGRPALYAMGLIIQKDEDGTLIWHSGRIEGFTAYLARDPDRDLTVVLLSNQFGGASASIGRDIVALARGKELAAD